MLITLYVLFFVPEKIKVQVEDEAVEEEEDEVVILPSQVPSILKDIMQNKHLLVFVSFLLTTCACYSIDSNVSQVYMTDEVSINYFKLIHIFVA